MLVNKSRVLVCLERAQALFAALQDRAHLAQIALCLGRYYFFESAYTMAIESFKNVYHYLSDLSSNQKFAVNQYLGLCYFKLNDINVAKQHWHKALFYSQVTADEIDALSIRVLLVLCEALSHDPITKINLNHLLEDRQLTQLESNAIHEIIEILIPDRSLQRRLGLIEGQENKALDLSRLFLPADEKKHSTSHHYQLQKQQLR